MLTTIGLICFVVAAVFTLMQISLAALIVSQARGRWATIDFTHGWVAAAFIVAGIILVRV